MYSKTVSKEGFPAFRGVTTSGKTNAPPESFACSLIKFSSSALRTLSARGMAWFEKIDFFSMPLLPCRDPGRRPLGLDQADRPPPQA